MKTNGQNINLNELTIYDHDHNIWVPLSDNSTSVENVSVEVYFRSMETRLIEKISQAQMVVGCIAWLTSEPILKALARVMYGTSIVVQKEDFLRPDMGQGRYWQTNLHTLYNSLHQIDSRYHMGSLAGSLSYASDPSIAPVRCVGNYNSEKKPAMPRMHNKFLVFCSVELEPFISAGVEVDSGMTVSPYAVWTGSFNLTFNAANSLENAVYIENEDVAKAYYDEWQQVLALSEPLDWTAEWVEPEWRIGT